MIRICIITKIDNLKGEDGKKHTKYVIYATCIHVRMSSADLWYTYICTRISTIVFNDDNIKFCIYISIMENNYNTLFCGL